VERLEVVGGAALEHLKSRGKVVGHAAELGQLDLNQYAALIIDREVPHDGQDPEGAAAGRTRRPM
jgi:cytoskeletal protein CcmA (bactofilin family)